MEPRTWSRGLPSSSGRRWSAVWWGRLWREGGVDAVNWGGFEGGHPVGVFGTLISLAVSPPLGALGALLVIRALRRLGRRASRRWRTPVRGGQWAMASALAFSHGANDAQKSVGVIAALLLAGGQINTLAAPPWVTLVCAAALTAGTALGGWRIIRTVGRRIYRIQPIEGLASPTASAAVIFGASLVGAPHPPPRLWPPRSLALEAAGGAGITFIGRSSARLSGLADHDAGDRVLAAAVFELWDRLT